MIILVLFLFTSLVTAQTFTNKIYLSADSLKDQHVSLDEAWKYSPGDDSLWADPDFNDSAWDTLNPKMEWNEFNDSVWTGIGWFRKEIIIDSTLTNESVALSVNHFGASQIFLNGKEVVKFGTVSADPDSESVYHPNFIPVVLTFGPDSSYILSVRYSNLESTSDPEWIDQWYGPLGIQLRIHEPNERILSLVNNSKTNFGVNFGIGGIFLSLAVLYFLLHLFYSSRRENLYYALFSFSLALLFFSSMLADLVLKNLTWIIVFKLIGITGIALAFLGYLGFIYSIFYDRMPKQIWFFLLGTILLGVMLFNSSLREYVNYGLPIFIFLATIEGFRSIIIAIKNKKEHSWVIGTGVIIFVSLVITIFVINLFGLRPPGMVILIFFMIGLFSLPSSMSVYLARSIATTNKKLEQKLIEIKDLSSRELEAQKRNADLILETEREKAAKNEAVLKAKASEAEKKILKVENERKTAELEEARELQLSMLPKKLPIIPHIDIAVYMQTATEVGGDYYDFHLSPDGTLTSVIGDATGHGLNAGTLVTITKSLFNSHASTSNIVNIFQEISKGIKEMKFKYLSMCLLVLKIKDYNIQLSSAGMPPALIHRRNTNEIEEVLLKGMPLGAPASFPYKVADYKMEAGDTILLMSDGFPELFDKEKKMLGYEAAKEKFNEVANKEPNEIISHLKSIGNDWTEGKDPDDDVTFVVIKMK